MDERQPEATKLFWKYLNIRLITEFSKNNSYEALIIELSQVKQEIFEKVKDYTDRVQDLSVLIT